jgi:hypothetical protein
MSLTNDTSFEMVVGPDVNGSYFTVAPGDPYDLPEPPRTVSDEEAQARGEETPQEAPSQDLGSKKAKAEAPTPPTPGEANTPAPTDKEGTQE